MASPTTNDFPLATETFLPADGIGTEGGDAPPDRGVDNEAGASGDSPGAVNISQEALIAIIVVVSVVAVLGISMAVLFYVAKKREWKLRESIRRSARKVVTALTPRRSEFPREVKESTSKKGRRKLSDDVPPTPRLRPEDLEKGNAAEVKTKVKRWGKK